MTMASLRFARAAIAFLALGACACGLTQASGQVGRDCDQARDCDAEDLGCVPVDVDNAGAGRACMPPPEDWTCRGDLYGNEQCDCGCAILDVDCPNALAPCDDNGNRCPGGETPDPADNTQCL
jgi:hypothetical protein